MSLITDSIGLGAALALAAGSGIQAIQAFDQLNDQTQLMKYRRHLILAALRALFSVVIPKTNVAAMAPILVGLGFGTQAMEQQTDQELVADPGMQDWVKNMKKWLCWFLGWFFIGIGTLAALAAAAWMLANDL
jgi:hypothetical protein